jgi:glutamate racemase
VSSPEAVLLGCTHYPLIASAIETTLRELGSEAEVIDSANATAVAIARMLRVSDGGAASFECFVTDSVEKFERLGSRFLGRAVGGVQLVDLGG